MGIDMGNYYVYLILIARISKLNISNKEKKKLTKQAADWLCNKEENVNEKIIS